MRIAIRTDASQSIGSGHVMRCLSLADVLRQGGAVVRFVTRGLPTHLAALIQRAGHEVACLAGLSASPAQTVESLWPAEMQAQDSAQSCQAVADWSSCDWVIVDHYALGAHWETAARSWARRIMALDDLARVHDCDLLLDQNLYPEGAQAYDGRLPPSCIRFVGPEYALLRPDFGDAHEVAGARDGAVRRLLVFMGGMDAGNYTGTVLEALARLSPPFPVDVVVGNQHPALAQLQAQCARLPHALCHVQTQDMARLCAAADMAIGAGGGATWERCAVGLPALVVVLAANQRSIVHHGARAGLLYACDNDAPDAAALEIHIRALLGSSGLRNHLSRSALAAVDGRGTLRVARKMLAP